MQSHFKRRIHNSATYTCTCCHRLTRETGLGESSIDLCAFCYEAAGELNMFTDGDIDEAAFKAHIADLVKAYGDRAHAGCVTAN